MTEEFVEPHADLARIRGDIRYSKGAKPSLDPEILRTVEYAIDVLQNQNGDGTKAVWTLALDENETAKGVKHQIRLAVESLHAPALVIRKGRDRDEISFWLAEPSPIDP